MTTDTKSSSSPSLMVSKTDASIPIGDNHVSILVERLLNDTQRFSDVTFVVATKRFALHSLILSLQSPPFAKLIDAARHEAKGGAIVVTLPAAECTTAAIFQRCINAMYSSRIITMDAATILPTLTFARTYEVGALITACDRSLTHDALASVLTTRPADLFTPPYNTMTTVSRYVVMHAKELLAPSVVMNYTRDQMTHLLGTSLHCTEEVVFDACMAWARHQCHTASLEPTPSTLTSVLAPLLPFIRFPTMDVSYLTTTVAESQLLTSEQLLAMIQYQSIPKNERLTAGIDVSPYNGMMRAPIMTSREWPIRARDIYIAPGYCLKVEGKWITGMNSWSINFRHDDTINLLHFNPRAGERAIVRNAHGKGGWGSEERGGGFPFTATTASQPFVIDFIFTERWVYMRINGTMISPWSWRTAIMPTTATAATSSSTTSSSIDYGQLYASITQITIEYHAQGGLDLQWTNGITEHVLGSTHDMNLTPPTAGAATAAAPQQEEEEEIEGFGIFG